MAEERPGPEDHAFWFANHVQYAIDSLMEDEGFVDPDDVMPGLVKSLREALLRGAEEPQEGLRLLDEVSRVLGTNKPLVDLLGFVYEAVKAIGRARRELEPLSVSRGTGSD